MFDLDSLDMLGEIGQKYLSTYLCDDIGLVPSSSPCGFIPVLLDGFSHHFSYLARSLVASVQNLLVDTPQNLVLGVEEHPYVNFYSPYKRVLALLQCYKSKITSNA